MAIVASNPNSVRATPPQLVRWQAAMKAAIRDPRELCRRLELPADFEAAAIRAAGDFPLFVPPDYLAKIEPRNPRDPLLLQVLPVAEELDQVAGFTHDPVADLQAQPRPGLIHKYQGRALLITTGACAIHCRYCFRRHFPYDESPQSLEIWQPALRRLAEDESIEEVVLSGGDPLTLVDIQLAQLVMAIRNIPHLRRLRVHTRLPIVIPERVTDELLDLLTRSTLTPVMVVHANHPRELEGSVAESLARLVDSGIPTLNQSVLLRGVNDNSDTLIELSKRLIDLRVMPYYLNQLDRVSGSAHFEVPLARGRELIAEMRGRLPGYAVPRYVQDNGSSSKDIIA